MPGIAARMTWVFGTDPDKTSVPTESNRTHGAHNNVLGSTGAGAAFNTQGWGLNYTFVMDSNDSAYAYQIRGSRTSSGPWAVLSSGSVTGTSTTSQDIVQIPGPFRWLSPRVDALASTNNYVIIAMTAME